MWELRLRGGSNDRRANPRFLTVIDEHTRQGLWLECVRHLTSVDVVRVLEQLVELYGLPAVVKSDKGSGFLAKKVQEWIESRGVEIRFIDPGSPWQNGHNERTASFTTAA